MVDPNDPRQEWIAEFGLHVLGGTVRKISAILNISMDGVIQAPGRSDEDTRSGFDRGGWAVPYNDEVMAQRIVEYRDENGSFQRIEDLMNVEGLGQSKYDKLKDMITIR